MNPSAHKTDNGPERDLRLDVLRGVAIAAILVAHSNPPGLLFQLRNFDVPLMGMLVGASFALSRSKEGGYFPYLLSRILRLATPVWLFLTFLFAVIWIVCAATDRAFPYGRNQILSSYLLLQGIGLVWIIRVFVLVAALLPLVRPLVWKLKPAAGILLCLAAFGVYDAARRIPVAEWHRLPATLYTEVFLFSVPYTLLALLGIHLAKPSVKLHISIGLAGMAAFGVQALYLAREGGGFVPTQEFKYPPQLYYLTYAIGASFLLSAAVEKFHLAKTKAGRALGWMGKQTMWIYLWHMLAIELLDLFAIKPPFMVRLMLIAGPSMLMSCFQHIAVERLVLPSLSPRVAAWVKRTFTG